MANSKLRLSWLTVGLASAGTGLLALTPIMQAASAYADPTPDLAAAADPTTVALIIGGSSIPIPPETYIDDAFTKFLEPNFPAVGTTPPALGLFTPEGLYPIYAEPGPGSSIVKQLPFETSVYQGQQILDNTVENDVLNLHEQVAIYGESQSATISGLSMTDLNAAGVPSDDVSFVLVGDPDNPFGGLLERFASSDVPGLLRPELTVPSLGVPFYGATPDDLYPTVIYTQEYDGFADFPRYPIDFLSDLNAFLGIEDVHPTYRDLSTTAIEPVAKGGDAILLPTTGATDTTYYLIPMNAEVGPNAEYLPLLQPLLALPVIGQPIADLLEPDTQALVNLGYGSPEYGYSVNPVDGGFANVAQPFGLFPSLTDFEQLPGLLVKGTEEGITNFVGDFTGSGPNPVSLAALSDPTAAMSNLPAEMSNLPAAMSNLPAELSNLTAELDNAAALSPAGILTALQDAVTNVGNTFTTVTSTAYATLLPTADLANVALTSMPLYDFNLFTDGITEALDGDPSGLVDAVGLPFAADTAMLTLVGGFELGVIEGQATSIITDLSGLFAGL